MAFPPYIGVRNTNTHVQICPSCNRACTIKIGWCTMSDMGNSDTTPFHVEVWGVEPLSVAKASSVASLLCCRCLPSVLPRQPVEGPVKKMILVSPTCILLSQAIAGRDRCRQICKSQNDYHCPRGGIRTPINSNKSV